ncbi:MAG: DUF4430 domain-containing protein [Candidatus Nomurabacteria bacterium]|nr:DUF4430 domain-containing protein [Candidatus Nomurabacteria bacterium]
MKKRQRKLHINLSISIFFVILLFLIFYLVQTTYSIPKIGTPIVNQEASKDDNTATILIGNSKTNLLFSVGTSLYNALTQQKNAGKITFSGKNYPSLGFFVTDIGTLHANNGKNLIYYINGKEASVGVSSYMLKDGDIIEWKLE